MEAERLKSIFAAPPRSFILSAVSDKSFSQEAAPVSCLLQHGGHGSELLQKFEHYKKIKLVKLEFFSENRK